MLCIAGCLIVYCALYASFHESRGGPVERLVIHDATVAPAASLVRLLEPGTMAHAVANRIDSPRGSMVVQSGCEGIETLFLLWAAIVVFPTGVRAKCLGILWGTALVYGLNQVRLVALFIALHHNRPLFEAMHGYVAPTLIIVLVGIFFLRWTQKSGGARHGPAAPG